MPHNVEVDELLISYIVHRLVEAYHPERVYLFGSMARGDAGPDSDYDILLVVPDDSPAELLSAAKAYDALWGSHIPAEIHVWSHTRFDSIKHLKSSLPSAVEREGRLLYAAPGSPLSRVA